MYSLEVLAADRFLRQGKYRDALSAYNKALSHLHSSHERKRVKTSIKLCRKHLGYDQINSYFNIDNLLRNDLLDILLTKAKSKDVVTIEAPLLNDDLTINAREISRRILISPFQTSLFLFTAKLTEELDLTQSIKKSFDSISNFEFSIGDLIGFIIDPLYGKTWRLLLQ